MIELRHNCVLYYIRRLRDLLRKRYAIECIDCSTKFGPFKTHRQAVAALNEKRGYFEDGRPWCNS
jgi:hypothetical protein